MTRKNFSLKFRFALVKLFIFLIIMTGIFLFLNGFLGCNRHSSFGGNPVMITSAIYENDLIICESRMNDNWARLFYISKEEKSGKYQVIQSLDLHKFMGKCRPAGIAFNDQWLVIGTRSIDSSWIPSLYSKTYLPYSGRVFVFKKENRQWNFHKIIKNPVAKEEENYEWESHIEMSSAIQTHFGHEVALGKNMLFCSFSQNNLPLTGGIPSDDAIFVYNLNSDSSEPLQKLESPHKKPQKLSVNYHPSFGLKFMVNYNTLLVWDNSDIWKAEENKTISNYINTWTFAKIRNML